MHRKLSYGNIYNRFVSINNASSEIEIHKCVEWRGVIISWWPVTPGINTLLISTGALGPFTCSGMTLQIYMGPTALHGIQATGDTLSNVESQVFTPYNFGRSLDRTPDLLTTRPTCYHSAMALCLNYTYKRLPCQVFWNVPYIKNARFVHCIPREPYIYWLLLISDSRYPKCISSYPKLRTFPANSLIYYIIQHPIYDT